MRRFFFPPLEEWRMRIACGRKDSAEEGEEILVFYGGDVRPEDGALARIADYFARHPETILAYADEDERLEENGGR